MEYKARVALSQDEEFLKIFEEKKKNNKYAYAEIDAAMFPQIWGSTCTGFDVTEDGSPAIGGCAMTKCEYMWLEAIVAGQLSNAILDEIRGKEFEFDATDEGIRNWIKDRGSEFVTNAVQEQKKAIQRLTMKAVREDLSPNELARVIRPCIGLTERQAQANLRYYNHIKEQLRKDHPRMKEETIVRRARDKALKYAEKQHRYRAETIAQTELAEAYNAGAHQGIKQAQERGYIGHVKKVWVTARQDNVCKHCEAVEGVSKEMDEYFDVGKCGRVLIPPAHPRCRCVVKYVEVEE